jgi:acyl carrier protein
MDLKEFCQKLESMLEMDAGSLQPQTRLDSLEAWDSVSVISFIAMADQDYDVSVPPKAIAECETVEDLAKAVSASKVG